MVPLLDMEKMFEIYTVLALRGPPPGLHEAHEYHLKKSNMHFEKADESYFFHLAPPPQTCYPPQGPNGTTLWTVMNNFKFIT